MKKIIFVHLLNDFSGSPKVLSQVISTCKNEGIEMELFTGRSSKGFLSNCSPKHHFYFYKRFENRYFTFVSFLLSQTILFFKLLKYFNKDIVIYVNTMLPFGAGLAGYLFKKPVYYHIHETSISPAGLKQFLRYIVQKTATKIVYVSNSVKSLEPFKKIEQKVIYNAVSDDFTKKSLEHNYQVKQVNSKFNVLMVCSLKAYKGVNEFIAVAEKCDSDKDISFILVLNAVQKEIDTYFSNTSIPDTITIKTSQKDLHPFYQNASLVLNLSRIDQWVETFGLTIIEAMSYGIPVIVPPVGGPTEIVKEGVEGYLISSYKVDEIAQKIMKLSKDEKEYLRLSKNAKKRSL
ncbi:MAG: glycosyltransferase involved in cell wall biosynthesis, partial [Flavobacteriaceae bacterium]